MSWDRIRRAAAGDSRGDWDRAMNSLRGSGFPPSRHESGYMNSEMQTDTGHQLWFFHQEDARHPSGSMPPGYNVRVWHPNTIRHYGNATLSAHLGSDPDQVGPLLRRMFGHPTVMQHLRGQMQGDHGLGYTYLDMTQN